MYRLEIYLLRGCPYSIQLEKDLRHYRKHKSRVFVRWLNRSDKEYMSLKKRFHHPTYPIVVLFWKKNVVWVGGRQEFISILT